jgi:hypothetical protein
MRLVLDGKSVAVGVLAGAALVAGIGAAQNERPEVGRFQIAAAGKSGETTGYVVDTATGQVWREVVPATKDAVEFLKPKTKAAQ